MGDSPHRLARLSRSPSGELIDEMSLTAPKIPAASAAPEYRRLPGLGRRAAAYTKLWLGPDHLLLVESTGFSEEYQRFRYSEVQALVIQRTWFSNRANVVIGILVALFVLLAFVSGDFGRVFLGVLAAIAGLIGLFNLYHGPSCNTYLVTAVQQHRLISLSRVRRARKAFELLRPRIAESQQRLSVPAPGPSFIREGAAPESPHD